MLNLSSFESRFTSTTAALDYLPLSCIPQNWHPFLGDSSNRVANISRVANSDDEA